MPKPSSTHLVHRFMEQRLRSAAPGGPLPSVRQVMDACRVGPQTVAEVVKDFEKHKLIEIQPKRGLFRTNQPMAVPTITTVDVLYLNANPEAKAIARDQAPNDGTFHGELITAMRQEMKARELTLRLHVPEDKETDADLIERIANTPQTRACMTVSLTELSLLRALTNVHLDVVNLFPASFQLPSNAITTDSDDVVARQLDCLRRLGHKRIGYLHNVEDHHLHRDILLRREAFYRLSVEYGLELLPGYVAFAGYHEVGQRQAATDLLKLKRPPTAIICADHHLPAVYQTAAANKMIIGRDLSVVGTDDKPIAREVDPPATSLRVRRRAAINCALDLLDEVSHGRNLSPTDYIHTDIKIIHRRSTGPAPADH